MSDTKLLRYATDFTGIFNLNCSAPLGYYMSIYTYQSREANVISVTVTHMADA